MLLFQPIDERTKKSDGNEQKLYNSGSTVTTSVTENKQKSIVISASFELIHDHVL